MNKKQELLNKLKKLDEEEELINLEKRIDLKEKEIKLKRKSSSTLGKLSNLGKSWLKEVADRYEKNNQPQEVQTKDVEKK